MGGAPLTVAPALRPEPDATIQWDFEMLFAMLLAQASLEFTCTGGGTAIMAETETVYGGENRGNSAWPTVHDRHSESYRGELRVRVTGREGSIKLPRGLQPTGYESDGWFQLRNVHVTDDTLTGSAAVNPLTNPWVRIDRKTGIVQLRGWRGSFSGVCRAASY